MKQDNVSFKSQYILEKLGSIDKSFTYNITHDSSSNVTSIVWITSYMKDKCWAFR